MPFQAREVAMNPYPPLTSDQRASLPGPLYALLTQHESEAEPFRKVHRLIDTFEWTIKWHAVLAVSDLVREMDLPDRVKVLLAQGLRMPSLGTWNLFYREALAALKKPVLPWHAWERLVALEKRHQIISFRNRYAHGATPADARCKSDCDRFYPVLLQLIGSELFVDVRLVVSGLEGVCIKHGDVQTPCAVSLEKGHAGVVLSSRTDDLLLDLWPLGTCTHEPEGEEHQDWRFFYFNALKNPRIEQLNYERSIVLRDKALWHPFHERLPLREWGKTSGPEADIHGARVDALAGSFKGRLEERDRLRQFCLDGKGMLMVWGAPGIGKSALLAQVFREVKAGVDADGKTLEGNVPPVIECFIRRGAGNDDPTRFLSYLNGRLDSTFGLRGIPGGNSLQELQDGLDTRLQTIETGNQKRVVLFVDGLDECPAIARRVPQPRAWLPVLCAGRQVPEIQAFFSSQDALGRNATTVGPLAEGDVRALLYDVVDKYESDFNDAYVEAVVARSEGNPLYLNLLCEQLLAGDRAVGDTVGLPLGIQTLHRDIVARITDEGRNREAVDLLHLLSEARAPLATPAIAEFLDLNTIRAQAVLDASMELLAEIPLLGGGEGYQLFHEDLRTWLRQADRKECREMGRRLADCCFSWQDRADGTASRYALEYGVAHLAQAGDAEGLWELLGQKAYRQAQIVAFGHWQIPYRALQEGIDFFVNRTGSTPEDDARLCRLVLRAGRLAREAESGILAALDEAQDCPLDDPDRMAPPTLARLEVLGEQAFFNAALLLLWIEVHRQGVRAERDRSDQDARRVLRAIDERFLQRRGWAGWGASLPAKFMAWLVDGLICVFPEEDWLRLVDMTAEVPPRVVAYGILCRDRSAVSAFMAPHLSSLLDASRRSPHLIDRPGAISQMAGLLARLGDRDQAGRAFSQAAAAVSDIQGDFHKANLISGIAANLCDAGELPDTSALWIQLLDAAWRIENTSHRSGAVSEVVRSLSEAECCPERRALFSRALRMVQGMDDRHACRSRAMSGIARALAHASTLWKQAEWLAQAQSVCQGIPDAFYRAQALVHIASALARTGEIEAGTAGFLEALSISRDTVHDSHRVVLVKEIVQALAESGGLPDFDRLFCELAGQAESIVDTGERANAMAGVVHALARAGRAADAMRCAQRAVDAVRTAKGQSDMSTALVGVADAITQAGDATGAFPLIRDIMEVAAEITLPDERVRAVSAGARALAQCGRPADAVKGFTLALLVAEDVVEESLQCGALAGIARDLARAGAFAGRDALFYRAVDSVRAMQDRFSHAADALMGILDALEHAGDLPGRSKILRYMRPAVQELEDGYRISTGCDIALALAEGDDAEAARAVFLAAMLPGEERSRVQAPPDFLIRFAVAAARIGHGEAAFGAFEQAIAGVRNARFGTLKARLLGEIAGAMARAGGFSGRHSLFQQVLDTGLDLEEEGDLAELLCEVVGAVARAEEMPEGLALLQRAMAAAREIVDPHYRIRALCAISSACAEIGDSKTARNGLLRALRAITLAADTQRAVSLMPIACAMRRLAEAGISHPSRHILGHAERLEDAGVRAVVLAEMLRLLSGCATVEWRHDGMARTLQAVQAVEDPEDRRGPLAAILELLIAERDFPGRRKWLRQLVPAAEQAAGDVTSPGNAATLARVMAATGDAPAARSRLEAARDACGQFAAGWRRVRAYVDVAQGFVALGDSEDGGACIRAALGTACAMPGERDTSQALEYVALAVAEIRSLPDRDALFGEILDAAELRTEQAEAPEVLPALARALAEADHFHGREALLMRTFNAASGTGNGYARSRTLPAIAGVLAECGVSDLESLLQAALASAMDIPGEADRAWALAGLARVLAQAEAAPVFEAFVEAARMPVSCWKAFVRSWREGAMEHAEDAIPMLRMSLRCYPFDPELAREGAQTLLLAHMEAGNPHAFGAITRQCPELIPIQ